MSSYAAFILHQITLVVIELRICGTFTFSDSSYTLKNTRNACCSLFVAYYNSWIQMWTSQRGKYIKITCKQLKVIFRLFPKETADQSVVFIEYETTLPDQHVRIWSHGVPTASSSPHRRDGGTCSALITNSPGPISAFTPDKPGIIIFGLRDPSLWSQRLLLQLPSSHVP